MADNKLTDVSRNTSAADLMDYWIANLAPKYMDLQKTNLYRTGTFGYINEVLSTMGEDSINAITVARREFYPNTAQYMKSLYKMAAARKMDLPMATPATARVLLMIQESDIVNPAYGTVENGLHSFVLDNTFVAMVDDIPFMLDYPIVILSKPKANNNYAHTTHYDFRIANSLATSPEKYIPNKIMQHDGTKYLIMQVQMRQIEKTYDTKIVTSNAVVNTVTMDFPFDGNLANFEVFYKEDDGSPRVQLKKILNDSYIPKEPFCWYTLIDDSTIRLTFPANVYFVPKLNSEISIEISTTLGSGGNFDSFESDIISKNDSERYPYNTQVPVFGVIDGSSSGGKDIIDMEEYRVQVEDAYATNHTFTTETDLQLYFNELMIGTDDRFKFTKKRDDSFIRLYGSFLLMKDANKNAIPTNTLDVFIDPVKAAQNFDLYDSTTHRYIMKPGAIFEYSSQDDPNDFTIRRTREYALSDDLSRFDKNVRICAKCGTELESTDEKCPKCESDEIINKRFLFTNPYLISVSTDQFIAGYFLNSTRQHHSLQNTDGNDDSIVQFIARNFKVERNAIAGENFYKFSLLLSPSIDLDMETIFKKNDDKIVASEDGRVVSITHNGQCVEATIKYESGSTQMIQVGSYTTIKDGERVYAPGYDLNFDCGEAFSKNDVIATQKPTDLGRIRVVMDLNKIMSSTAKRYVPFVLEEVHDEDATYFIYSAYLSTNDMIDSSKIMQIQSGFALTDGSDGNKQPLSIPIDGLGARILTFYEYRKTDEFGYVGNAAHQYRQFAYLASHSYTNTYELFDTDSITLIQPLDFAKGYLDTKYYERPEPPITPPETGDGEFGDLIDCEDEKEDIPEDENTIYLRTKEHQLFATTEDSEEIPSMYLVVSRERLPGTPTPNEIYGGPIHSVETPPDEIIHEYGEDFYFVLRNCPVLAASWMNKPDNVKYFIEKISQHYAEIGHVQDALENAFTIDLKFYNTYGRSRFYKIGSRKSMGPLDSVNVTLSFGVSLNFPASAEVFRNNFREFVKERIESVDDSLTGNGIDIFLMNIVSEAKAKFDEIYYLEYYGMNDKYNETAQRITIMSDDEILETVPADSFVPEFLNVMNTLQNSTVVPDISIQILY